MQNEKVIGVDVGYGNTKTANCCFSSGVKKLPGKPPLNSRVIETSTGFYAIGSEKVSVQKSKTDDESMRVLTMAGIAEEMRQEGLTTAAVHLGVGVPLTRMGAEKQAFIDYYNRIRHLSFTYEDISYCVDLLSVDVFPQGSFILGKGSDFPIDELADRIATKISRMTPMQTIQEDPPEENPDVNAALDAALSFLEQF